MKKLLLRIAIALLVVIILVVLVLNLFLDGAVKRAVETFGPRFTRVDVKLDKVSLSLLSGVGDFKGLMIGNPPGYKTEQAISVGSASFAIKPTSLLSDKVVIRYIHIQAPKVALEGNLAENNLSTIVANIQSTTGGSKTTSTNATAKSEAVQPSRKLEVDDFVITDAKVSVSLKGSGQEHIVSLPDIHLSDLGTGPEGITSADLTREVIRAIEHEALKSGFGEIGKAAQNAAQGLANEIGKSANSGVSNVTKSIGDLFKK
jgi:uncharacterized protein involved in outer membrane biogenesis